jgi:hypothetical protein
VVSLYYPPVYSARLKRRIALAEEALAAARIALSDFYDEEDRAEALGKFYRSLNSYAGSVGDWRNDVDGDLT